MNDIVTTLTQRLRDDPADSVLRQALADALYEAGEVAASHRERARAMAWEWVRTKGGMQLHSIHGKGRGPKHAAFCPLPLEWGEEVPLSRNGRPFAVLVWRMDRYDVPGDYQEGDTDDAFRGEMPWLRPGRDEIDAKDLPALYRGVPLGAFCAVIERAGGWWWPAE